MFLSSGWIASLALGLLDLPEKIVSFAKNAPEARETASDMLWDYQRYTGRFTSDPKAWKPLNLMSDGTEPTDNGQIQLAIEYGGNGRYYGEIHSAYMAEHSFAPWSRVMIDGEIGPTGTFRGEVWDIVNNQRAPYARFHLAVDDPKKGTLRLTPLESDDGVFPGEVVLWPTDFSMADGHQGKRFQELLTKAINPGPRQPTPPGPVSTPPKKAQPQRQPVQSQTNIPAASPP